MSGFRLVGPEHVADWLASADHSRSLVLLEAHFHSIDHPLIPGKPNAVHIPGSIQIHPSYLEAGLNRAKYYPHYDCPADGRILPERELVGALERLGIRSDSLVVVYGTEPAGPMAAARLVWGLLYAGVTRVRLLDGGIDAWLRYGGIIAGEIRTVWDVEPQPEGGARRTAGWRLRPELRATTDEVRKVAAGARSPSGKLIDVRKSGEWDGSLTNYYRFFSEAGHIPTAVHQGDWDNLLDPHTQMLEPGLAKIARRWREQGIVDGEVENGDTTMIFYCGTGWRSSVAFLVAGLLGFRAKNYDGGFYSWSRRRGNQILKGGCARGFRPVYEESLHLGPDSREQAG